MAKQLDEFPEGLGVGRPSKYPWADWLNTKPWELEAGTDFSVELESFRMTAKAAAKSRNGTLKAAKLDDKRLVIQFVPNP
jgi:hypothetical protein